MTITTRRMGFGSLDGVIALGIIAFGFLPGSHLHHTMKELLSARLTLIDMVFGISFIYLWRYCFTLLKLYDKFATIPSRMITTGQGVVMMILPAIAFYSLAHPHTLTVRAVIITSVTLYCWEINRAALSAHALDRLAARDPRRAIIIGSGKRASKAWRAVRTRYRLSLKLVGFVDNRNPEEMPPDVAHRYLGSIDDLSTIVLNEVVDLMLIAMPLQSCYPKMQQAIQIAESAGVQVFYLEDIYASRTRVEDPHHDIFRELAPDQEDYLAFLATKRLLDILGAALGLILFSPFFVVISILIKLTSKGPVLLRQQRCGYRRRQFTMLTFRSMVNNAEHVMPDLQHANEPHGPTPNISPGSRVWPLGKFLRTTSLDELPQLWNVFIGDMSLVGPRPMSIRDVSVFDKSSLMRRFSVRPGMTGLWQVSGRSSTSFDHWVIMDNTYIDKRSLALDLKILALTVGAVVKRSGAL